MEIFLLVGSFLFLAAVENVFMLIDSAITSWFVTSLPLLLTKSIVLFPFLFLNSQGYVKIETHF